MVDVATLQYKLVAVINKGKKNITRYTENLSWEENRNEISGRITFTCRNSETKDGYLAQLVKPGCPVFVYAKDGKKKYTEVARGTVVTWTPANQSSSHDFRCVCYDMLYNLQKSQDSFFFRSGTSTKTRINKILGKWKVPLGRYEGADKKHGKKKYQDKYLSDILLGILDDAVKKGGRKSVIRMEKGKVSIIPECSNKAIYVFKGSNINAAVRNRSTESLVTRVKVTGKSKDKGKEKVVAVLDGLVKYGIRQKVYHRGSDESLKDARKAAQEILNENGTVKLEVAVESPDVPYIRKGDLVYVQTRGVKGYFIVCGVQHNASSCSMSMELEESQENNVGKNKNTIKDSYRTGDIVTFNGGRHYVSSSGQKGYSASAGKAKITKIKSQDTHPYHLVHTDKGSNVYGWVDSGSFK